MSVRGWLGHGERKCLHVQVDMTRRLLPTILLVSCYLSGDLPAPLLRQLKANVVCVVGLRLLLARLHAVLS